MNPNICPCPKSPSHVGLHIPAAWFAFLGIDMDGCHGKFQSELDSFLVMGKSMKKGNDPYGSSPTS